MERHDYTFPFRIDPTSHQGARTGYEVHVEQMIRQVLLTTPGERADLPEFGCGIRHLLFAPQSEALEATTRIQVQRALERWLGSQIQVQGVDVTSGAVSGEGEVGQLLIDIRYNLIEALKDKQLQLEVR
jgi:phage baseplate assembly protein W